jgi:peptidoglycan/LPS O-acetylase OafA/YrhL
MPSDPRPPLRALTGLRFVAALQVLLYHVYAPGSAGAPGWVRALVGSGYVGVGLFFVLSGFVLAYNYLQPMQAGHVSRREFWLARLARVYPVYLLGLIAGMPVFVEWMVKTSPFAVAMGWVAKVTGASVLLVQAWAPQTACALNCPGWSLSAEAFFYAVFPLLVVPVQRASTRRLLGAAAALWVVTLAFPLLYLALAPDHLAHPKADSYGMWLMRLKFTPLVRLPEFVVGVVAGRLFAAGAFDRLRSRWMEAAAVAATLAVLLASPALPYPLVHNGLLTPLFAALVVLLALGLGPVSGFLSTKRMELLGGASYALYILHLPLNDGAGRLMEALAVPRPSPALYTAAFAALATLVAVAVFRWVEEPARRALRRRLSAPRPASGRQAPRARELSMPPSAVPEAGD